MKTHSNRASDREGSKDEGLKVRIPCKDTKKAHVPGKSDGGQIEN